MSDYEWQAGKWGVTELDACRERLAEAERQRDVLADALRAEQDICEPDRHGCTIDYATTSAEDCWVCKALREAGLDE